MRFDRREDDEARKEHTDGDRSRSLDLVPTIPGSVGGLLPLAPKKGNKSYYNAAKISHFMLIEC